mmetsp:Transcript_57446/g.159913  ORF Transcript_57446/g.159913 Transcript_57446/m.159913 type:complete len:255 (-) Transcript_57446:679-1443(-)
MPRHRRVSRPRRAKAQRSRRPLAPSPRHRRPHRSRRHQAAPPRHRRPPSLRCEVSQRSRPSLTELKITTREPPLPPTLAALPGDPVEWAIRKTVRPACCWRQPLRGMEAQEPRHYCPRVLRRPSSWRPMTGVKSSSRSLWPSSSRFFVSSRTTLWKRKITRTMSGTSFWGQSRPRSPASLLPRPCRPSEVRRPRRFCRRPSPAPLLKVWRRRQRASLSMARGRATLPARRCRNRSSWRPGRQTCCHPPPRSRLL